jgi:hypothetical protein
MSITYQVPTVEEGKNSTYVTFINEKGETFKRLVNVPRNLDGTVDVITFTDILEAQLSGIINKAKLGVITFTTGSTEPITTP